MSSSGDGGTKGVSPPEITQSAASRLASLSLNEDYFNQPQSTPASESGEGGPPRPASPDLPASLALPLARTRSSTPQSPVPLRAGPSVSVDDDSASIRSFVPTLTAGEDLEAMLSEMLGSDTRWRMEHGEEEIDVWEGESEGDEGISDVDSVGEPEDPEEKVIRWRSRRKHFFVLSAAGKPIYSRYGDDSLISGYMGVIQAIISFFEDNGDTLKSFSTDTHIFVVSKEGPLYLVAISSLGESESQLRNQLDFLYAQILSTLTLSSLNKAFSSRANFDLRDLLGGTEIFLDALADAMIRSDPGILLGALEVAKLRKTTRDKINTALLNARHDDLLYGMIVAEGRLLSVIRPRRHSLHPSDMQLLFSMVFNSSSLCNGNEHWIPLCLPKFNAKGFLHAYIWAQNSVAVILISADKNAFFNMRSVKAKVIEDLEKSGTWSKIHSAVHRGRYTTSILKIVHANEADIGVPRIVHFIYKSKIQVQFTMPAFPANEHMTTRVLALYRHLHAVVHARRTHIKIFHYLSRRFSALVWVGAGFECYVVAEGKAGRSMLAKNARAVVRWVRAEETRVFVSGGVVF